MATSEKVYFPSVRIKRFKAIDDLNLNSLARINLIAGDNNVGKSTLLEGLYIFAMEGDMDVMAQVACERMGYPLEVDVRDEKIRQSLMFSFFPNWKFELGKSIFFQTVQGKALELRAVYAYRTDIEGKQGEYYFRESYAKDKSELVGITENVRRGIYRINGSMNGFYPLEGALSYFELEERRNNVQFIHTSSFSKELNARLWNCIALTGLEKYVVEALRVVDSEVENLAFIEETVSIDYEKQQVRMPYVTLKDREGRFPLNVMGDGMNRILSLVLGIVNSANGVCLIDEIENGIYYRRQPELWKMIGMLAEQLDVQVFVTTHSLDCVRSFADMARGKDAQLIRLEKRAKGITAVCYSAEELQAAISNDIELR